MGRLFGKAILATRVKQITEKDYLSSDTYYEGKKNTITMARRLGMRYPFLGKALSRYGLAHDYFGFADFFFLRATLSTSFMGVFLYRFFSENFRRYQKIYFMSSARPDAFNWFESLPENVILISWHHPFVIVIEFFKGIIFFLILCVFPFINALYLIRKGVRPNIKKARSIKSKPFLLVHLHRSLIRGHSAKYSAKYRDMYFLKSGCIKYDECVHYLMATSEDFDEGKIDHIIRKGGTIISNKDLRPHMKKFICKVFIDYYRLFFPSAIRIMQCSYWNHSANLALMEGLHFMSLCPFLFEEIDVSAVVFETEEALFSQIAAIEARRRGHRTVSMIHGAGGQNTIDPRRFELQMEDMITYGNWDEPLRKNNPVIRRCIPCGNIEIDQVDRSAACLPKDIRKNRAEYKVVGFLARLSHVLTTNRSEMTGSSYLDEEASAKLSARFLKPFFNWVRDRDDIILLWKTTLDGFARSIRDCGDNHPPVIEWVPWMAPLMADIPSNRFVYSGDLSLEAVVANCDLCIGNDVSSAIACAMSAGTPAISFDLIYGGLYRCYHPRMVAEDGQQLVDNSDFVLQHGFPNEVFRQFNKDFYGRETVNFQSRDNIRSYFRQIIEEKSASASPD